MALEKNENPYNRIISCLNNGDEKKALQLLQKWKQTESFVFNTETAILEGSVLLAQENYQEAQETVLKGLSCDSFNAELYFMLGRIKEAFGKIEQAQFSYENAVYYSEEEDYETIASYYDDFCAAYGRKGCSIILLTYNQLEMTKLCIESIRQNVPSGTYEIIVVDNASTDGTREWLAAQEDIRHIFNEENRGFPAGCNQGADAAEEGNDIFLLNNDTVVMKNSIYTLRMALYEEKRIGAAGSCSNHASKKQDIEEKQDSLDGYAEYAGIHNIYLPSAYEKRLCLSGFAMMIKRCAWIETGGMDENYGIGNFEDDDLSLSLLLHEYHLVYCPNSFIYHFGGRSFDEMEKDRKGIYNHLLQTNKEQFNKKWGVRWGYFSHDRRELIEKMPFDRQERFSVLDIGCGMGAMLLQIGNEYPNAKLYGIELDKHAAELASHWCRIVQGNIEDGKNPFDKKFDCIIFADVLEHLHEPAETLSLAKSWLNPGGRFLISLPNVMHISVIYPLLHGKFEYQDQGILDRTHLRFFTRKQIISLLDECGLSIERMGAFTIPLSKDEEKHIVRLTSMDSSIPGDELTFYQYWIVAGIKEE